MSVNPASDAATASIEGTQSLAELERVASHLSVYAKLTTELAKRARAELNRRYEVGTTTKPSVPTEAGPIQLATITKSFPQMVLEIHDQAAFIAWAKEKYPKEVVEVPAVEAHDEVRPAFWNNRFHVTRSGRASGPNGEADIPGVIVVPSKKAPYVSVKPVWEVYGELWDQFGHWVPEHLRELATDDTWVTVDEDVPA